MPWLWISHFALHTRSQEERLSFLLVVCRSYVKAKLNLAQSFGKAATLDTHLQGRYETKCVTK